MRSIPYIAALLLAVAMTALFLRTEPTAVTAHEPQVAAAASSTDAVITTPSESNPAPKPATHASPTSQASPLHRVIKVVDGDTLTIDIDGAPTTLRLIGLDTPETVDPRKAVQCFGKEASDKAKQLLSGTRVSIERDASQGMTDKYGRTLAYIIYGRRYALQ